MCSWRTGAAVSRLNLGSNTEGLNGLCWQASVCALGRVKGVVWGNFIQHLKKKGSLRVALLKHSSSSRPL